MNQDWPVAELDPVRRMRVLAAATPGVAYAEKLIPAPFSAVWEAPAIWNRNCPVWSLTCGRSRSPAPAGSG